MRIQYEDLPPIEDRHIIHSSQAVDNYVPEATHRLLVTPNNEYVLTEHERFVVVSCPFHLYEGVKKEDMNGLLRALKNDYTSVSFCNMPSILIGNNSKVVGRRDIHEFYVIQNPFGEKKYARALNTFANAGFTYEKLGKSDLPGINTLVDEWFEEKRNRILLGEMNAHIRETKLDPLDRKRKKFNPRQSMKEPLTEFYGAFSEGNLVAITQTMGNDHFQHFEFRASKRRDDFSPQEYLDNIVCMEFVQRGVKIFDRGSSATDQRDGLIKYKEKFGRIGFIPQVGMIDAYIQKKRSIPSWMR